MSLIIIKSSVKYLLFFVAFLLSGYGDLSYYKGDSTTKDLKKSGYASVGFIQYDQDFIIRSCPSGSEKNLTLDIAENEVKEDELIVSKKHLGTGSYFTSIFFAQALGYYFNCSQRILSSYWYFSSASPHQYLIFQVFRI